MANEVVIDIKVASGDAQAKMHDLAESIKKDTLSWTEFLKERMGPAMREYGSHTAAMQALSAEYKQYKSTLGQVGAAQEANTAVIKQAAQAQEGLIGKIRGFGTSLKPVEADLKRMGLAISGFGAVGTAAFALMVKAAQEQQIGIQQLDQALVNIGKSYAGERAAIEGVIEVLQRKTNFGDEAQRKSLQTMITLSGSYEDGLRALPAVLDLAAGKHMGLEEASSLVGRALAGNTERLGFYGIEVAKGATATEIITTILAKFQGQAEAAADPITQMKTSIGNASEAMGKVLLPAVNAVAGVIGQLAAIIANLDPRLLTIGVTVGVLAVAFASIAGPALLFLGFLPAIVAGFTAIGPLASAAAAGVSGLAASFSALIVSAAPAVAGILAVVAVAAAGAAELVALKNAVDNLIMGTEKETNAWKILKGDIENLVDGARDLMGGFTDLLIPSADVEKILTDMGVAAGGATDAIIPLGEKTGDIVYRMQQLRKEFETLHPSIKILDDNAEGLKTSFSDLSPKLLALGYPMEEIFVQAQKLVDELGMELPAALDAVVEAIYPGADKAFKDTINNVLGLNKVLSETRTWTEPASSAYLDLVARMQTLGRPMEDLLPLAQKLADTFAIDLGDAIELLSRDRLDMLDAELRDAVEGMRALGNEAGKTADAVRESIWTQTQGIPTGTMLEQIGRNWAPQGVAMQEAAQLSSLLGMKTVWEGMGAQDILRKGLGLGEAGPGALALPLQEIARAISDLKAMILLDPGQELPLDALLNLLKNRWEIPALAQGGIVTQPTLAYLGERGREAVVPLEGGSGAILGAGITVNFYGPVFGERDMEEKVSQIFRDVARRGGFAGVLP